MKRRSLVTATADLQRANRDAVEANQRLIRMLGEMEGEVTFRSSLAGLLEQYRRELETGNPRFGLRRVLDQVEAHFIRTAMQRAKANIALAAEMLRVPEATLRYKLAKHALR
jgi:DNA-binding protein Fis